MIKIPVLSLLGMILLSVIADKAVSAPTMNSSYAPEGLLDERKDPYRKLAKLYERDAVKCLEKAESLAGKRPYLPSPHYFTAQVHFDKYKSEKVLRKKAGNMSRTLSALRFFYRSDTSRWAGESNWTPQVHVILDSARKLTSALLRSADTARARNIARKLEGITGEELLPEAFDKKAEKPVLTGVGFKYGQFFGLPTGSEEIPSHSVQKEKEVVRLINVERQKRGMNELVWEEDLARAARYHAYDMATQGYFDHDSYDSLNGDLVEIGGAFERMRKFYTKTFINSENLAAGSSTAYDTYQQWFFSKGHNANMFNKSSAKVGVGVYYDPKSPWKYYWAFCTAY